MVQCKQQPNMPFKWLNDNNNMLNTGVHKSTCTSSNKIKMKRSRCSAKYSRSCNRCICHGRRKTKQREGAGKGDRSARVRKGVVCGNEENKQHVISATLLTRPMNR